MGPLLQDISSDSFQIPMQSPQIKLLVWWFIYANWKRATSVREQMRTSILWSLGVLLASPVLSFRSGGQTDTADETSIFKGPVVRLALINVREIYGTNKGFGLASICCRMARLS